MDTNKLIDIFIKIDDFCQSLERDTPRLCSGSYLSDTHLSYSEVMTILICFHESGYRCFKWYYQRLVSEHWKKYFPNLVSYNRFIELQFRLAPLMFAFLEQYCQDKNTGLGFVDSSRLIVCHNRRIHNHKVFKGLAYRGKTSVGWFYGFKIHLAINHFGEIVGFSFSAGNVDDRNRKVMKRLIRHFKGILVGDKGYVGKKLAKELAQEGVELITKRRKNMKPQELDAQRKLYLKRRGLSESVYDILKDCLNIEHTRYRNPKTMVVNVLSGLIAYCFREQKPHLHITKMEKMVATKIAKIDKNEPFLALTA